jgi:hypothetical protein
MTTFWNSFATAIRQKLGRDDDEQLWQAAVDELYGDADFLIANVRIKSPIFTRIGSCSHWLSPHNNGSWLPDARYAWPPGYGGSGWSIFGLPEFDWSLTWKWSGPGGIWMPAQTTRGKRPLTFRVAIPARTARHSRAVVHAVWIPGSPTIPEKEFLQAYGFLKVDQQWICTATCSKNEPYEVVCR